MITKIQTSENGGKDLAWICNYYLSRSSNIKEHIAYRNHQTITCIDNNCNEFNFQLIPN